MFCPKCGEKLPDGGNLCPHCGARADDMMPPPAPSEVPETVPEAEPLPAAEEASPADAPPAAETAPASGFNIETGIYTGSWGPYGEPRPQEAPAEKEETEAPASGEAKAPEKKKKHTAAILISVIIALLVVIIVCLSLALYQSGKGETLGDLFTIEKKVDGDDLALTVTDETGTVTAELTNRQLCFYYWGEYYYYVNYYGFSFDASQPLDQQTYSETGDSETGETAIYTWQDYFMDCASNSFAQTAALKAQAQADGFQMPEDYQAEYDSVVDAMPTNAQSAGFTTDDGQGDVLAYIQDSYGSVATLEDFEDYLYDSYYVSAYSNSVYSGFSYDDSQLEEYYDSNTDYFTAYGLEKSEQPNINVRHILIEPEADENGDVSDAAWDEAEQKAREIYAEWKAGEATEDSFADMANEHSGDGGSNTNGGLYESVYPGQMVTEFNDWCFDESREPGDTDVVKTTYGYHIMYFVGQTDEYYWKSAVEGELRYSDYENWMSGLMNRFTAELTGDADVAEPDAVKQIRAQAAQEAESSAAGSSAAG